MKMKFMVFLPGKNCTETLSLCVCVCVEIARVGFVVTTPNLT